jgi:hypothetical protein
MRTSSHTSLSAAGQREEGPECTVALCFNIPPRDARDAQHHPWSSAMLKLGHSVSNRLDVAYLFMQPMIHLRVKDHTDVEREDV